MQTSSRSSVNVVARERLRPAQSRYATLSLACADHARGRMGLLAFVDRQRPAT
jgi:hypothetical protein